jgi:hypothetical protein
MLYLGTFDKELKDGFLFHACEKDLVSRRRGNLVKSEELDGIGKNNMTGGKSCY